jgi:ribosomal subunit interface protein
VDIVVSGRNVVVPDHYRQLVAEKLSKIERFDHKVIRIDVELQHERNRRQSGACQHVEITCKSRGPVIRSEACAADFYAALDAAVGRLETRLRRAADRRRVHYGQRRTQSILDAVPAQTTQDSLNGNESEDLTPELTDVDVAPADATGDSVADDALGAVVRHKQHDAVPMSVDQALHEMELVGHDFYLFADVETGLPSVVYRRKGYAYGVIQLNTLISSTPAPAPRTAAVDAIPTQTRAYATRS